MGGEVGVAVINEFTWSARWGAISTNFQFFHKKHSASFLSYNFQFLSKRIQKLSDHFTGLKGILWVSYFTFFIKMGSEDIRSKYWL